MRRRLGCIQSFGAVIATALISGMLMGVSVQPAVASSPAQLASRAAAVAKSPAAQAEGKQLASGVTNPALADLSRTLLAAPSSELSPFEKSFLEVNVLLGQPSLRMILAYVEKHETLTTAQSRTLTNLLGRLERNPAIALLRREGERLEQHPAQLKTLIAEVISERSATIAPATGGPHSTLEEAEATFTSTSSGQSLADTTDAILSDPGATGYIARQPPLIVALLLPAKQLLSLQLPSRGRPKARSRAASLLSLLPNCTAAGAFHAALTTSVFAAKTYLSDTLEDITKDLSKGAIKTAAKELLGRAAEKFARTSLWFIFRAKDAYDLGNEGVSLIYNAAAQCGAVSLEILPTRITRPPGYAQSYSFIAYDGNHEGYGAISPETLTIADGTCDLNAETCESQDVGPHVVTATFGAVSGRAELIVQQAGGTGSAGSGGGGPTGPGASGGGGAGGTEEPGGPKREGQAGSPQASLSVGGYQACTLLDGGVWCWASSPPHQIPYISNAAAISTGYFSACSLSAAGTVKCWGEHADLLGNVVNEKGEPITETYFPGPVPVEPAGIAGATSVSVGALSACASLASGNVACWGKNADGELGDGSTEGPEECELPAGNRACSRFPVDVVGVNDVVAVSVGVDSACALLRSQSVDCWGGIDRPGTGGLIEEPGTPFQETAITEADTVTAGAGDACSLLTSGHIECWGSNQEGDLGDGTHAGNGTPVEVSGISTAVAVSAGFDHTCAVLDSGRVECWGSNQEGALGDGTEDTSYTPVEVVAITNAVAVSAGYFGTCALLTTGQVECWGNLPGISGYGHTDVPVEVDGL